MKKQIPVKNITFTAMFLALNIALSSFGIPVPGGHFYLNDVIICVAAILLNPFYAFIAGGIGSFLGDFFFYPAPMLVSLVTHGLQSIVISLLVHKFPAQKELTGAMIGVVLGAIIMVVGYSLGRAFIYSTPEYALLKLPYQILQAGIGVAASITLCYPAGLKKIYLHMFERS